VTALNPDRILVPIDFSEACRPALAEAAGLAKVRGAPLTLLHVHQIETIAFLDFTYVEPPEKLADLCDAAEKQLASWRAELVPEGVEAEVKVVTGSPVSEIINLSGEHDLIVMATHGRTGLDHFLMGSVAERVVQAARCSVLIVKGGGGA